MSHFVVVYKITKDFVFVSDPSPYSERRLYTKESFCAKWVQGESSHKNEGLALLLEPIN